jgi:hypothetical protein
MKRVVCPICGGTLVLENLCQYGEQQEVFKNGKIKKKVKKVDHGSMEFQYVFCEYCRYCPYCKTELDGLK